MGDPQEKENCKHKDSAKETILLPSEKSKDYEVKVIYLEDQVHHSKKQLLWMMVIMTSVFFLNFIGYFAMESMQSSINPDGGLGATAVALATFLIGVFSAFGSLTVQKLSPKWTMFLGSLGIVIFVAVNFYPTYAMLYTGSVAVGMTDGPFFVAQAVYMSYICDRYAVVTKSSLSHTLSIFCGVFQFIIGMSRPIAFIISAFVLKELVHTSNPEAGQSHVNFTNGELSRPVLDMELLNGSNSQQESLYSIQNQDHLGHIFGSVDVNSNYSEDIHDFSLCGASHCPFNAEHSEMLLQPDENLIHILISCYTLLTSLGLGMCLFLRNIPSPRASLSDEVKNMLQMVKKDYIMLLTFSFMALGVVESMEASSFYPSFVSCTLGLGKLSYVMITEGFTVALFALLSGFMAVIIPRYIQMAFAFIVNIAVGFVWLAWQPTPEHIWVFFVLAIGQGCTVGIYRTQVQALLTEISGNNTGAAISVYFIYWFCTKGVVFAYSPFLCYTEKTFIYLAVVVVAFITYGIQEVRTRYLLLKDNHYSSYTC